MYHQTHPGTLSEIKDRARQFSLLSFWASWLPCFHTEGVVWLWIPKVLRHTSDRQTPQMLLGQTWRTHTCVPSCHSKDLPCSSAAWSGELPFIAASKKETWQNISELRVHQVPNLACVIEVQWGKAKLMWRGCQAGHLFPLQSTREYLVSRGTKRGAGVCISLTAAYAMSLFWAMCLSSYTSIDSTGWC